MAKRPHQLPSRPALTKDQIDRAEYVGSPEHKVQRWWGGLPDAWEDEQGVARRPGRQLTTICRLVGEADRNNATLWVREALKADQLRYREADKDFPWHIWYRDDQQRLWVGQCVNSIKGHYKGWPISEEQKRDIFD